MKLFQDALDESGVGTPDFIGIHCDLFELGLCGCWRDTGHDGLFSAISLGLFHTQNLLQGFEGVDQMSEPEANWALASAIEANEQSATAAHSAAPTAASSLCEPSCIGIPNSASSDSLSTGFSLMPLPEPTSFDR